MKTIDLNVDLGEGCPNDLALLKLCSSANVCCGAHAGNPQLTQATLKFCQDHGIRPGAHPGYPDPSTFGRTPYPQTNLTLHQIRDSVRAQIEANLTAFAYIKPHGAFYNDAVTPGAIADLLTELLELFKLPLLGLAGTHHQTIAAAASVQFIREGFADRAYTPEGHLVPRTQADAILKTADDKARQALALASLVDSVCVHGDEPDSLETLASVRQTLESAGYTITP